MNDLQVFNFEGNNVRTVLKGGQPWFVAKDVCDVLEIKNTTDTLKRLDSDEVTRFNLGGLSGETNIVNEYGLYTLVLGSRKPEAKKFKRWITHEVIPSIRKTGSYNINSPKCIEDVMIQSLQEMKAIKYELATAKEIATTAQENINNIKDNIIIDLKDWRDDVNKTIKKIGAKLGDYRRAWRESYEYLEKRARCNLDRRLQNYTKRLIKNGAPKRKVNEACYLDVIDQNERLRQIYIGVVKEMSIRYLD